MSGQISNIYFYTSDICRATIETCRLWDFHVCIGAFKAIKMKSVHRDILEFLCFIFMSAVKNLEILAINETCYIKNKNINQILFNSPG